jgi:hypothetical protein
VGMVRCTECKREFVDDDVIYIGDSAVCAVCKPVFLQRMSEGVQPASFSQRPIYFPISIPKFIALSFATLGLYHLYWFYQNWKLERLRTNEDISPIWRTIFLPVFTYSLFHRIYDVAGNFSGNLLGLATPPDRKVIRFRFPPSVLAAWYVVILVFSNLDPFWFLGFFTFVPLVFVQQAVAKINTTYAPKASLNRNFTGWNIVILVLGGLLVLLILLPLPEE